MLKLLLASQNSGKLREMQFILQDLPIQIISPTDINIHLDVKESGKTYAENAALKAKAFAEASGLMALGDDSGLEVDALNGEPGLYSARYAPIPDADDGDRRDFLLKNLLPHPRPWTARFRATIAIAQPNGEISYTEGICEGEIIPEERGSGGFGYDPIFYLPELGCTMAELDEKEKNRLSHRAKALEKAKEFLRELV
ncbi:MAG: RdgB/HAM1 family non-canonical purine NTP pyrophosphatase [Anaerolineae bacterium]|jgi:XTP/dITP diphosphohydrolase|nr:RdgB/HAM1 family non-canonical purine NTP pyrophosphatase [Anaerolineae bacterium]MBT4310444.1 RdgB/HAM1 family non-canonical purine NTP pyrophosphatase [Anaerolineae bacterium]MBT4458780.1 RdgB/HAM1 family non-canonical purine NTP pyrophosphatase [Anaerolineae bacterium]MBT4842210.1 RdgB/HAM1 family non-canonical purine NTP pyrophosphatase [Anaerolineae bacterium]MBT6062912.1 RdgB/HAM1 family non-canonical purine NTP pyrophosphatase [Anaerolineae bacterium]